MIVLFAMVYVPGNNFDLSRFSIFRSTGGAAGSASISVTTANFCRPNFSAVLHTLQDPDCWLVRRGEEASRGNDRCLEEKLQGKFRLAAAYLCETQPRFVMGDHARARLIILCSRTRGVVLRVVAANLLEILSKTISVAS